MPKDEIAPDDHRIHLEIPPSILAGLLGASLLGGAGGMATFGPSLDRAALQQCFDNSATALEVAAQHGEEFVDLNRRIRRVEDSAYSRSQAKEDFDSVRKRFDLLEDRQEYAERKLREIED